MGNTFNQQPPSREDSDNLSFKGKNLDYTNSTATYPNNYIPIAAINGITSYMPVQSPGYRRIAQINQTTVPLVNSAAETDLQSFSVAANSLAARGGLIFRGLFRHINTSGTNRTCTFRLYFGGTAFFSSAITINTGANRWSSYVEFHVDNKAAGVQHMFAKILHLAVDDGNGAGVALAAATSTLIQFNSGAIDTTAIQILKVTAQLAVANPALEVDMMWSDVELIEP